MKKVIIVILLVLFGTSAFGQDKQVDAKAEASEILIRKQIVIDDLERQVKNIPFAAVRVFTRYKVAAWLWKDGKDDTARAEDIAVAAAQDLYENKNEIPPVYISALAPDLLALLDRNSKQAAKKLREKYKLTLGDNLISFEALLNEKNGEKFAVDSAIRSLADQSETNSELIALIGRLNDRQSKELLRLLSAVVQAEELGRTKLSAITLVFISHYFVKPSVPSSIQKRYLKIVLDKSRVASVTASADCEVFFDILSELIPHISTDFPDLLPEAGVIHAMLRTRVSQESREAQERNDRIRNAPDKLSALVSEAELASTKEVKYDLYLAAAQQALELKKFTYAIALLEKTSEIELPANTLSKDVQNRSRDQFRSEVVEKALQFKDAESANYAIKRITDFLSRAESYRKLSVYYFDNGDAVSSGNALDEAIKLVSKSNATPRSISSLLSFLPIAQKLDQTRISEIGVLATKYINSMPTLNPEDKPDTENYKNYVTSVMIINWNLLPALTKLIKENRLGAVDLADRIGKKEIRVVADYVLLTDSVSVPTKKTTKDKSKAELTTTVLP